MNDNQLHNDPSHTQNQAPNNNLHVEANDRLTINLPVLRESNLPKLFPLSSVNVSFPTARHGLIVNTMIYKIDFTWNGEQKTINRRFSEIENLREALVSLLPFSFVFPTHRKQLIV